MSGGGGESPHNIVLFIYQDSFKNFVPTNLKMKIIEYDDLIIDEILTSIKPYIIFEQERNKRKLYSKKWRNNNKEKFNELCSYHTLLQRVYNTGEYNEKCRNNQRNWIANNREKFNKRSREYLKKMYQTPEGKAKRINYANKRRANYKDIDVEIKNKLKQIYNSEKNICYWCGKPIAKNELAIDHIIPLSKGGSNTSENITPSHKSCNNSKNNKMPWEFVKYCLETGRELDERFVNDGVAQATLF
jgi:5-methylcytosine-specific restriction endonuclease McrA